MYPLHADSVADQSVTSLKQRQQTGVVNGPFLRKQKNDLEFSGPKSFPWEKITVLCETIRFRHYKTHGIFVRFTRAAPGFPHTWKQKKIGPGTWRQFTLSLDR